MSGALSASDEAPHEPGLQGSWNESRYVDVSDTASGVGAWLRLGNRPNEGFAEVSVCVHLPDETTAFMFERTAITGSPLTAGGQSWTIDSPYRLSLVTFAGEMLLLPDAWALTEPRRAFGESMRVPCSIELESSGSGIESVMGRDQGHIARIFLPGQADWHYQHLVRTSGTVRIGERTWSVSGHGGRDHSWGPRNWLAKTYLRWLIAAVDNDLGFMLTRAVGPTKQTRSGFVWQDGAFHLVDDFEMHNRFAGEPHHELRGVDVVIRSGARTWIASGEPKAWLPLRHVQRRAHGPDAVLRIVKSPATWIVEGRPGEGMLEYHDLIDDGRPAGLHD